MTMMIRITYIFLLFFSLGACAATATQKVSIEELTAEPEKYIEKRLKVSGYFKISVGSRLFTNKEQAESGSLQFSVAVMDATAEGEMSINCHMKSVSVDGVYKLFKNQYFLMEVTTVVESNGNVCWASLRGQTP